MSARRSTYRRPTWSESRAARDLRDGVRWAVTTLLVIFAALAAVAVVYLVVVIIVAAMSVAVTY